MNNSDDNEHSQEPSIEEPQEQVHIESGYEEDKDYHPTVIISAPNVKLSGALVIGCAPVAEGATQDEPDVTCQTQPKPLDITLEGHTETVDTPIGTLYNDHHVHSAYDY